LGVTETSHGQSLNPRIGSYLFCDYNIGGGFTMAYMTDATTNAKYMNGITITSEAQKGYRKSLTFQASIFYPVKETLYVPVGNINYTELNDANLAVVLQKAHLSNTYANFSFGHKKYLTGSFQKGNSLYLLWEIGIGIAKTTFSIENYDPKTMYSPYYEAYSYDYSILGFGAAGLGVRKQINNYEFFWELKGHYFIDSEYIDNLDKDKDLQNPLNEKILIKSIPNYYAINIGARIII
jgi:hypothetical protein